ncbi:Lymphocyte transmembrane adapter 1 [Galemys pyrenaicus]|uniref:Lymphocyte transmembrane adapter 1 n=1 Tax=Galemys pyrenaicus TaxID=202257 RepID=A0A8J6AQX9_GALPY|nr:Lymphocyte transmembrane adapter 1 [Galemys pyrenaicus]
MSSLFPSLSPVHVRHIYLAALGFATPTLKPSPKVETRARQPYGWENSGQSSHALPSPTGFLFCSQASPVDSVLQPLGAQAPALGHAVGICDRATELQTRAPLCPSAHNTSARASRVCSSSSSEDSRDYINIPTPEELAEALASTGPGGPLVLPSARELQLAEEGDQDYDHTGPWSLVAELSDPRSDGDSSSQSSNDYINIAEVGFEVSQEQQCKDYENVPPAGPHASQQQLEEGAPFNTDPAEGQMDAPDAPAQPVVPSGKSLAAGGHVSCQLPAQEEHSAVDLAEEVSNDSSNDYENVPPVPRLGDEDTKEGSDPQLLPRELASSHLPESLVEWSSEDS